MNGEWTLASNCSRGKTDGVTVTKVKDGFTVYRYIEDWDEEGDTIYAVDEYLMDISEKELKLATGAQRRRCYQMDQGSSDQEAEQFPGRNRPLPG